MNYSELNPTVTYGMGSTYDKYEDSKSFSKYQEDLSTTKKNSSYYCGGNSSMAMRGMQIENTPLSEMFFSPENMNRIQKKIRREIFRQSKGQFKLEVDQDDSDLLLSMRATFADHAKHLPSHIVRQVKELNAHTVDYIVPDMLTNIKQHTVYLKNLDKPIQTIDRPINVNNGGRKTLPSLTSVWGF